MIFTCDVKSDIVVTGGVIVGSVGAAGIVVVVYYMYNPCPSDASNLILLEV